MGDLDETEVTRTGVVSPETRDDGSIQPGDLVGRFSVVAEIGCGGMGRIFEAQDPNLQRRVALKVLHEQGSETHRLRLVREAQALARLEHPNVVTVHEVGNHEGAVFIAMELVTGGTLKDWTVANPPGSGERFDEALRLLVEAGRGILAAHGSGLVHRDIKPSNILIGADGRARVADFGIVRSVREAAVHSEVTGPEPSQELYDSKTGTLTRTGASVGTPAYMAPEQFGDGEVGEAADQFSLCVTAWETLLGERPFQGKTVGELLGKIRDGNPVAADPSLVPESLLRVLRKGLRLWPGARHPTLTSLVEELDSFATTGKPAARLRGRRFLAGAGLATFAAAAVAYQLGSSTEPCPSSEARFSESWNPDRASLLASADPSFSGWRGLEAELDGYAAAWIAAYDEACEVALIREEQSRPQMAERQACLDLEQDRFDAALDSAGANGDLALLADSWDSIGAPEICDTGFSLSFPIPEEASATLAAIRKARSEADFVGALRLLDALPAGRTLPGVELQQIYERGMCLQGVGRMEEGAASLKVALDRATLHGNRDVATRAALTLAPRTPPAEADRLLKAAWATRDPDDPEHERQYRLAEFLVVANWGSPAELVAAVDRLLEPSSPAASDPAFLLRMARALVRYDIQFELAMELLDRVESEGHSSSAYRAIGVRCLGLAQRWGEGAEATCAAAVTSSDEYSLRQNVDAVRGSLQLCASQNSAECGAAVQLADDVVGSVDIEREQRDLVALDLARYLANRGETERGLALVGRSCRADEVSFRDEMRALESCAAYATALAESGYRKEAKTEADRISRLLKAPRKVNLSLIVAHGNVGGVYNLLGMYEEALEHSRIAATLALGTPLEESSPHRRANVNFCGGAAQRLEAAEAIRICEAARKALGEEALGEAKAVVLVNLGAAYFNDKKPEDAARVYRKAIAALEEGAGGHARLNAVARANLGEALETKGDTAEGARYFLESFERCEATWSTYYFAGTGAVRTLARSGDVKQAREVLARMRAVTPKTATLSRAQVEEAAGAVELAVGKSRNAALFHDRAVDLYTLAGAEDDAERVCADVKPRPRRCP